MKPLEILRVALGALRANRMRSLLTILGIIIGVAALVCMVAVGSGAEAQLSDKIRTLGTNLLVVTPGSLRSGGAQLGAGKRPSLTEDDAYALQRELGQVQIAAPALIKTAQVIAGNRNWATSVVGTTPDYLLAREWTVTEGRAFDSQELEMGTTVAVIGQVVADELFGGEARLGERIRIGDVPFTVIAILDRKGQSAAGRSQDDVVFIPIAAARSRVFGGMHEVVRQAVDLVAIKVADAEAVPEMQLQIAALLRQRHRLTRSAPDDFSVTNPSDAFKARQESARTLGWLFAATACISLIVGGISIMNIMLVSVTERTREIGLRMAVGARRRDIRRQFVAEAVALAMVGGVFGALVGIALAVGIALQAGWPVLISPMLVLVAFGFAATVGVTFGFYPAYRASCLDPMEALRFE